jgi:ribosomal protein L11 methylase PrmA
MRNPGSFRDPSAYVFSSGDRIFRAVDDEAYSNFLRFKSSGACEDMITRGWIVATEHDDTPHDEHAGRRLFEHPKLAFVSYPYEWPFALLKRAALLHLDIHLRALDFGFTLSDATAYNVQFVGIKPIFIDTTSFVPYREGDYWTGHRQFVEQFVNPLLLRALFGVSANSWYRGALEGLPTGDVAHLIGPVRRWFTPNVLINITLPDLLQRRARRKSDLEPFSSRPLPKTALRFMLRRLREWISQLEPKSAAPSPWQDYDADNSYPPGDEERKRAFVAQFARTTRPSRACDVGCNTGYYSEVLLQSGARSVIGFDSDTSALELAVSRAVVAQLNFLPLFSDAANPSPAQGWAELERSGLRSRINADAMVALAIVHHLAIARNIPLSSAVEWLMSLAPRGVIEFIPKSDLMVQRMLRLRTDIFTDYSRAQFEAAIARNGRIARALELSPGGRTLYEYERIVS